MNKSKKETENLIFFFFFFFFFSVKSNFISLINIKIVFSLVATATRENTALSVNSVK